MKKTILSPGSGVDLNYFRLKKYIKKNKILFFKRLLKEKGIREFINASNKINKLKLDCEFQIVGNFDKNNPSSISKKKFENLKNLKIKIFRL